VLRGIFGPKKEEAASVWKKLYNMELHNSHSSADII